jgi:hypothetical protein
VDLPDQPDRPDRARRARDGTPDAPRARDLPDPDERARAYEAIRAHVSAETAGEASPDPRPDEGEPQSHRDEAPQLRETRADQDKRSTGERRADRSADPPEPDHDGGDLESTQGPDAEMTAAIGRVRETEPTISADMRAVERENRYGGWLEGFERRLKGEGRLKEKLSGKLAAEPRMDAGQALREVADAIRYTFCFQSDNYARGYYDVKERLEDHSYEMYYSKNWWTDPEYKGINTRWVTTDGQRFEVQFHTPESFHAKHHVTHVAYEKIRDPATSDEERGELEAFQRTVSASIDVPDGTVEIPDVRKDGF